MKAIIKTGKLLMLLALVFCLLMSMTVPAFADAPSSTEIEVVEVGGGSVPSSAAQSAGAAAAALIEAADANNTATVDDDAALTDATNTPITNGDITADVELTKVGVDSQDEQAPVDGLEFSVDVKAGDTSVAGATTGDGSTAGITISVTTEGTFIPGRVDQAGANGSNYFFYMDGNTSDARDDITTDDGTFTYGGTFKYIDNVISFGSKVATSTLTVIEALATVNGIGYDTLQGATDAATESGSGTVEMQRNGNGDGVVVDSGSVTYNFNNYTYTIDGKLVGSSGTETNGFQLLQEASKVVMNNGTLIGSASAKKGDATGSSSGTKIVIQNYSNLTLNNMNVVNEGGAYVLSNNNNTTKIIGNSNITADAGKVAIDCTWWPSAYPNGSSVVVDTTGTVTGNIEMGMYGKSTGSDTYEKFLTPSNSILTINNIKHNGAITQYVSSVGAYGTGLTAEENEQLFTENTVINAGVFKEQLPLFATIRGIIGSAVIDGVNYTTVSAPATAAPAVAAAPAVRQIVEVPSAIVTIGGTQQKIDLVSGTLDGAEMPIVQGTSVVSSADTAEAKAEAAQIVIRAVNIDNADAGDNAPIIFAIARIDNGKSLSLSQPIELSIPVSTTNLDGYVLYYIDENGNQIELEYELIDGKIVFETPYVGAFMLVKP